MKKYFLFFLLVLFIIGCKTQDGNVKKEDNKVQVLIIKKRVQLNDNNFLNISINFNTKKEQKNIFKLYLNDQNVLSAQIMLSLEKKESNDNKINLIFRRQDFKILFDDNQERYAMDSLKVYERNQAVGNIYANASQLGILGIFVILLEDYSMKGKRKEQYDKFHMFNFNEKEIKNDQLEIGGFLFFDLEGLKNKIPDRLIIEYEDVNTKELKTIDFKLNNLY